MSSTKRNAYIDQWRGISVAIVIVNHLCLYRFHPVIPVTSLGTKILAKLAWMIDLWAANLGMVGVNVFFVISGYIITSLMAREDRSRGTVSIGAFYVRRSFRIIPAMLLYVGCVALFAALGFIHLTDGDVAVALTYVCNTGLFHCARPFSQLWSLAVEEQFYLVWPVLFLCFGRYRVHLVALLALVGAATSVMPGFLIDGWLNNGLAVYCLSMGALFALSTRFRTLFRLTARIPLFALVTLLVFLLPFAITRWQPLRPFGLLLLPWLISATVCARAEGGPVSETLRRIGIISYSLYLWHVITMMPPGDYLNRWFAWIAPALMAMAWISYRFVEQPFNRIGHTLSSRILAAKLVNGPEIDPQKA
jgi:peptidoglycan/LPS O-acetylase OafA/YrhL